jgi:hypothetical protein
MIKVFQVDYQWFPSIDYPLNVFPKHRMLCSFERIFSFTFNREHWLKHGKIVKRLELAEISSRLIKSPRLSGNCVNWLWLRSSERRSMYTRNEFECNWIMNTYYRVNQIHEEVLEDDFLRLLISLILWENQFVLEIFQIHSPINPKDQSLSMNSLGFLTDQFL